MHSISYHIQVIDIRSYNKDSTPYTSHSQVILGVQSKTSNLIKCHLASPDISSIVLEMWTNNMWVTLSMKVKSQPCTHSALLHKTFTTIMLTKWDVHFVAKIPFITFLNHKVNHTFCVNHQVNCASSDSFWIAKWIMRWIAHFVWLIFNFMVNHTCISHMHITSWFKMSHTKCMIHLMTHTICAIHFMIHFGIQNESHKMCNLLLSSLWESKWVTQNAWFPLQFKMCTKYVIQKRSHIKCAIHPMINFTIQNELCKMNDSPHGSHKIHNLPDNSLYNYK